MSEDIPVYVFRFTRNGKVLAEAEITIADEDKEEVWRLFQDNFGGIAGAMVGNFHQTMRIACGQVAVAAGIKDVVGMQVVEQTTPMIVVPQSNGHMPDFTNNRAARRLQERQG